MSKEEVRDFDLIFDITPESATIDSALMLAGSNTRIVFQTFHYGAYELAKTRIEQNVSSGEFRQVGEWDLSGSLFKTIYESMYGRKDKGATLFLLEKAGAEPISPGEVREGSAGVAEAESEPASGDEEATAQLIGGGETYSGLYPPNYAWTPIGGAVPMVRAPATLRVLAR